MKFLLLISIFVACAAHCLALKNVECGLPPLKQGVGSNGNRICRAYMPTWSYNLKTNECVRWVYGGCGGNANQFGSEQKCQDRCKEFECGLPPFKEGNGNIIYVAYVPSWSYDLKTNECVWWVYGGCGANANRFGSAQECNDRCKE
ncbi:carboxypeptidase inhibitor SmCI-like [Drosophila sulfurigaster albostrigata]|uniref:carboxypeptidase inhibitor SmCI-like n=1 Tax=Drosophila sulfurigaster albostrigata TaxID=89887 RepID=UPI002D21E249|nr:carboxypeptidase inhibitor SmCI-like [Drosophila sulfurigaster albostrigata]